jgi:hypothetical protein
MHPNSDPHGLPASQYAAGQEYPNVTMLGLLQYSSGDPLYPNTCSVSMQCESGPATSNTFIINPGSHDANNVAIGTAILIKACAYDNR